MRRHIIQAGIALLLLGSVVHAEGLAVVVGKNTALDAATSAEIVAYFRAEKTKLPNGTKISIVMREPGSPERTTVLKEIHQMSDQEYQKYFLQATFTGAVAAAPKQVNSASAIKAFVASTPGAIGYIKASEVDDSVKAVKIDGKAPGDAAVSKIENITRSNAESAQQGSDNSEELTTQATALADAVGQLLHLVGARSRDIGEDADDFQPDTGAVDTVGNDSPWQQNENLAA